MLFCEQDTTLSGDGFVIEAGWPMFGGIHRAGVDAALGKNAMNLNGVDQAHPVGTSHGLLLDARFPLRLSDDHDRCGLHVAANAAGFDPAGRAAREILAEGDKVLCFTQFTEFAEMLLPHLSARFGTDVAYLHGGTTKKRRDELVRRFLVR